MSDTPEANTFNLFDRFRAELETAHRVVIERKNAVGGLDTHYILHAPSLLADLPATNAQIKANTKVQALVEALRDMRRQFSPYPSEDTERWREEHEACEAADAALASLEADT